jgi:tetratricopeptide (TPR) repeat protein
LNDVAYFLSEKGVQLDKALQYAESAVTTTAITLRNVEAGSLKLDDLYYVASLAAYWDTLGWVYFQKGDLDAAEKYIRAAWTMQQHGDVAYHLGMIEEKRGMKDEAIRFYAQGTEAFRTSPEVRDSLMRLAPPAEISKLRNKAKQELRELNVINMGQLMPNLKDPVQAEFYVVFGPDATRNSQVLDVKFINGVDSLKSAMPALKALKYSLVFPDNAQTKVIRRGALHCVPKPGGCTFTMISPDVITSVD